MRNILPEKIRWRVKKLGFATPERKWQKAVLKPLIEAATKDPRLHPYISSENAARYFDELQQSDALDFAPWRWLNLSLWMRVYDLG
jgi:asparagine synthase (glutamine-hydrolysing)